MRTVHLLLAAACLLSLATCGTCASLATPVAATSRGRGRGRGAKSSTRGRGVSRRGANREWFARRAAGDPAARRRAGPRAKRWEREGDSLYEEFNSDPSVHFRGLSPVERRDKAEALLAALAAPSAAHTRTAESDIADAAAESSPAPSSPFMWGSCSIGPVLRSRLADAGMVSPFPIQEAAFTPISKGKNVVIGSATGSGKTLAFILPLVATSQRTTPSRVLVITPSRELTMQLRREVDLLWPPLEEEEAASKSAVHIVGELDSEASASDEDDDGDGLMELLSIGDAPILVGTPHSLRRLMTTASTVLRSSRRNGGGDGAPAFSPEAIARATQLKQHLKTVVIDEADQLLESAAVAQHEMTRRRLSEQQGGAPLTARQREALKKRVRSSTTELLMDAISSIVPLHRLQLVCASATVGRSLRRQLQGLLNAPSIEKAAELISAGGGRDAKGAGTRRAALMPEKLQHKYWLVDTTADAEEEAVESDEQEVVEEEEGAEGSSRKASAHEGILSALTEAMRSTAPAPSIVFCGRSGVKRVVEALKEAGMRDVRLLQEADGESEAEAAGGGETAVEEEQAADWASTPIYVGSERWGRGLDLVVDYVFLLSAPASSAQYAHLAGRTGRKGRSGTAVTLLIDTQAPRLVGVAASLGLRFERLES